MSETTETQLTTSMTAARPSGQTGPAKATGEAMSIKLNRSQVLEIHQALQKPGVLGTTFSRKLCFLLGKLDSLCRPVIDAWEKAQQPTEEFKAYDKARQELVLKYARKDPDGKPIVLPGRNGRVDIPTDDIPELEAKMTILRTEHATALEQQANRLQELNELLKEEEELEMKPIPLDLFPESVSWELMRVLHPVLKGDE